MNPSDQHSEYLARAVAALTPAGRRRADELLEELAESSSRHEWVARFAITREAEADSGTLVGPTEEPSDKLTGEELGLLRRGFELIRDQEPADDVADWANAVVALLRDEQHA